MARTVPELSRGIRQTAQRGVWLQQRLRRGLFQGWGIVWGASGYAELVPLEIEGPGPGEITIRTEVSSVSPGTERAQYLRLPGTSSDVPPGYSASGTVLAVGAGVSGFRVGDPVAASGVAHASTATVSAANAYPIPPDVALDAAALVQLGVICAQAVEKCSLAPGEDFGVVGAGVVGRLAQRLASAAGGAPGVVVARSRAKEELVQRGGVADFLTEQDHGRIAALGLPVVIEATGSPDGVKTALAAAGDGARIVLLGSPRGVTHDLSIETIREKHVRLIGAHVQTIDLERTSGNPSPRRWYAQRFLDALQHGLRVDDLLGEPIDPRAAPAFYVRLVRDEVVAAHFDWSRLPSEQRASKVRTARVLDKRFRGAERRLAHPLRDVVGPLSLGDFTGELRVGICGCGEIAVENAAAAEAAPNVRVTACFDPNPQLAADLAERHAASPSDSYEVMLARADVDAVFICAPHHLHAPLAEQAARAGKHVIVEKPAANDLASALEMKAAAREAGVTLSICFPHRYEPHVLLARSLATRGALGEVGGAAIKLLLDKPPGYWVGGYTGRTRSDWRRSRAQAGGGILIMNVSHYLDLLRHLTGLEVEAVTAFTDVQDHDQNVEDIAALTLRLTNGAIVSVLGGASVRGSEETELRLWGSRGQIVLEPERRLFTLHELDEVLPGRWTEFGDLPPTNIRAAYLARLATSIARGEQPDVTADDGLAVQAVIEAAYESAVDGRVVRPADLLGRVRA